MNKKLISIALLAAGSLAVVAALPLPESVHKDFKARRAALGKKKKLLDAATDKKLTADERAAMEFLYTYMTDPDLAGYSPEFYLENVRSTLRAREEMPWGKTVPAREFLHFVLPLRVNNEALDMARPQFYAELRDRVKGLSMKDAILEVNRWCHEKVPCTPSAAVDGEPGHRSLRRGIHLRRGGAPLRGNTGAAGLHPALGAHRRQPRMGGGLGRRGVALHRRLRAGTCP